MTDFSVFIFWNNVRTQLNNIQYVTKVRTELLFTYHHSDVTDVTVK